MAELHGSQAEELEHTAQTVSRLFLRGQAPRDPNGL
jgi:hypothetical protein